MKTYLATIIISFDIICNDNDRIANSGYPNYTPEEFADTIKKDLESRWTFDVSRPVIKLIKED